jgi:hypothetical protein
MRKGISLAGRCAAGLVLACCAGSALAQEPEAPEASEEIAPEMLFDEPVDLTTPLPPGWQRGSSGGLEPSRFVPKATSGWNGKVGVDNRAVLPDAALRPERFVPSIQEQSTGVAWANVNAPGLMTLDQASFETRLDPQQQGRFGMNLSRSVPLSGALALTWRQGYSVTHSLSPSGVPSAVPFAPGHAPSQGGTALDSNQAVGFTFLPANTTFSLGAAISSDNERWLRSLSAEQKLFGGPISIIGTVQETSSGVSNKSLKAGIKTTW